MDKFKNFKIVKERNEEILHLFLKPNFSFEFAQEDEENLNEDVNNYIKKKKIKFKGKLVKVFLGTVLVGSVVIGYNQVFNHADSPLSNQASQSISSSTETIDSSMTIEQLLQSAYDDLDIAGLDAVSDDFTLPLVGLNDTTISWTSNHPAIAINNNVATVTKTTTDVSGSITATIGYQANFREKEFSVVVVKLPGMSADERLEAAYENLQLPEIDQIENDFTLPLAGIHETIITWTSNNPAITIANDQAIVSRAFEDVSGNITAIISYQEFSRNKTFMTTVTGLGDNERVLQAANLLEIDNLDNIISDFALPASGQYNTTITYQSLNPAITIEDSLAVITQGDFDQSGDIIATISYGTSSTTKNFPTNVARVSPETRVAATYQQLNYDLSYISTDFPLQTAGDLGVTISYQSDNPALVINDNMALVTQSETDQSGILLATITFEDATLTKEFNFTVAKLPEPVWLNDTEYTEGLGFRLDENSQSYTVYNEAIANTITEDLIIPSIHQGLPVTIIEEIETTVEGIIKIGANIAHIAPSPNLHAQGVAISPHNSSLSVVDNMVIKNNEIIRYLGTIAAVTIPDNIETIGEYAFANCKLDELIIPETVKQLENNAMEAIQVDELIIPQTVTSIAEGGLKSAHINNLTLPGLDIPESFLAQAQIETISFVSGTKNIGDYAFFEASITNPIILPEGTELIARYAFSNSVIGEITFPDSLYHVEEYGFYNSQVKIINLGENLYSFANQALRSTRHLEAINAPLTNSAFRSDDGVLIDNYNSAIVHYPANKAGDSYSLPENITKVNDYAFEYANITDIYLNGFLFEIGSYAFKDSQITKVTFPTNVYYIGAFAFQGAPLREVTILSSGPIVEIGELPFDTDSLQMIKLPDQHSWQQYQSHYLWAEYVYYFTY